MGRASKQRFKRQLKLMVDLSFYDPERFENEWEMRVNSWLRFINTLGKNRAEGRRETSVKFFDVLDRALLILSHCNPKIRDKHLMPTYEALGNACSVQIARFADSRIYQTAALHVGLLRAKFYVTDGQKQRDNVAALNNEIR